MGSSPIASIFLFMRSGALAQLGARNIRIVEVVGSNPICSMSVSYTHLDVYKRQARSHRRCKSSGAHDGLFHQNAVRCHDI